MRASRQRIGSSGIAAFLLFAAIVGCSDNEVRTTTRNLRRPGPIALFCAGRADKQGAPRGLPLASCDPAAEDETEARLFGLVANTARGDLAVFGTDQRVEALVDLSRDPGFDFVAVGSLPTALAVSDDGCRAVSANSGSCDLSFVDLPGVLEVACRTRSSLGAATDLQAICPSAGQPGRAVTSRIVPRTSEGPLQARPQDVIVLPNARNADAAQCDGTNYRAYVTFPSCGIVAELSLRDGLISQALVVRNGRFELTSTPRCTPECGPESAPTYDASSLEVGARDAAPTPADARNDAADAADADAGGAIEAGPTELDRGAPTADAGVPARTTGDAAAPLPFRLAWRADSAERHLYVSSAGAPFITVIDLDANGRFQRARPIALVGDRAQTKAIALSPPDADLGQFVYAVAADQTVRVISTKLEQECQTNLDLAALGATNSDGLPLERAACYPVSENPPRELTADGPGIGFAGLIPQTVAFVKHAPASDGDAAPRRLNGVFALIALSDGSIVVVDVADRDVLAQANGKLKLTELPHRVRNDDPDVTGTTPPESGVISVTGRQGGVPVIISSFAGKNVDGVLLRGIGRAVADPRLIYEEQLVERFSGQIALGHESGDPASRSVVRLEDRGAAFCGAGVLDRLERAGRTLRHGDIATLIGCEDDEDCGLNQVCRKPQVRQSETGLCLDADRQDDLFTTCRPWLRGQRAYVVRTAQDTALTLDVLPVDPQRLIVQQGGVTCRENEDCAEGYYCVRELGDVPGYTRWTKSPGSLDGQGDGAAVDVQPGQCARPGCEGDSDCPEGTICTSTLASSARVCAAVPPPLDPWPPNRQTAVSCQSDADCQPEVVGQACDTDAECVARDPATECRRGPGESTARQCRSRGWKCADFPGVNGKWCMRASPCFNQLQRYAVNVGRSYRVSNSLVRRAIDPETLRCTYAPSAPELAQDRVPIGPALYPFAGEPRCEKAPALPSLETPRPNPCFQLTGPAEGYAGVARKQAGAQGRTISPEERGPAVIVRFANPDVTFSVGVSHLSLVATPQAGATVTPPPAPERGLTITLRPANAYAPLLVREDAREGRTSSTADLIALPAMMTVSPDGKVYLSDGGDRGGSQGSNGQVLRVNLDTVALDEFFVR